MEASVSTWQAAARRKWLALDAEKMAASARVNSLTGRRSNLTEARNKLAAHLKELETALIKPDSTAGAKAHENRILEVRSEIESADGLLTEIESEISHASALAAPKIGLANAAKAILEKLGVITKLEAAA